MFERIGLCPGDPADSEQVADTLLEERVTRLFTLNIPFGGYCGLDSYIDDDGDSVNYRVVEEHDREYFMERGIEILVTEP
ncbi:hypothetical protein CO038_01540 [Candidatus Pacearchaeota archaeon CG_4_9_14_0_2_um_filter_39_13]|nr:hypothetical protein [Candidatus Pacearchaeota archaeon]OIO42443.1 MAG: hypothetical protein AUJ64_03980 [Candidatus Pacearchaeota archaeon CG1_02_39_14]PJC44815.1 MAG: hypothetical protein CO038_01540 [Candidatus Pacearchaeota archaeon CG_4_9_14_0_2_um_filter_39_13]